MTIELGLRAIAPLDRVSQRAYMAASTRFLKAMGVKIDGAPLWISPRTFWDSPRQGLISIGDRVVISHYVRILTHDFSLDRVAEGLRGVTDTEYVYRAPVKISTRAFVGLGATILPGVTIGEGSIIAAGAVVTSTVAPSTVVGGVPAKPLMTTVEYWERRADKFVISRRRR